MYMESMARKYAPNRIREIRKSRGMSMETLGAEMVPPITLATVQKLETGQMGLTLDYINDIARILDVAPGEIITAAPPVRHVPILGGIAAGTWSEALEIEGGSLPIPSDAGGPRAFALEVLGESMNRIIADGGFVVVDPDRTVLADGKAYAVSNGDNETTFKIFRANPPQLEPSTTNDGYVPIPIGQEPFKIIGQITYAAAKI